MKVPVSHALLPEALANSALAGDLQGFLNSYGGALLLLVRLNPEDQELTFGLGATAGRGMLGATMPPPVVESIEFHTVVVSPRPRRGSDPSPLPQQVAARLESGSHFAVPLRKRQGADAAFMDRISVGRARNKDIVLRHSSVSKFHAWFESDGSGECFVSDAGSKNATQLNGSPLLPRSRTKIEPGDVLRFGSIEAFLCSPTILFEALH
jgi:FHA domain